MCLTALVGAACGGGTDSPSGGTEGSSAENSIEVTADNFAFSPVLIQVTPGVEITLVFTNDDSTQHSFTSDALGVDLTVDAGSSDTATFTAPETGTAEFHCKFHDTMTGTIATDGSGAGSGSGETSDDLDY
jgi:plastocyanin